MRLALVAEATSQPGSRIAPAGQSGAWMLAQMLQGARCDVRTGPFRVETRPSSIANYIAAGPRRNIGCNCSGPLSVILSSRARSPAKLKGSESGSEMNHESRRHRLWSTSKPSAEIRQRADFHSSLKAPDVPAVSMRALNIAAPGISFATRERAASALP